jgi:DNA replication protein
MWHKQRFINTMTYLLEELHTFEVSSFEALVLVMVHHFNEHQEHITLEKLSKSVHESISKVDDAIEQLQKKGYLVIEHHQGHVHFNLDACFQKSHHQPTQVTMSLHDAYEQGFKRLLSEKEYNQLALWSKMYSQTMILHALRQAIIQDKLSMAYIGRILENWKKANMKDEDLFSE